MADPSSSRIDEIDETASFGAKDRTLTYVAMHAGEVVPPGPPFPSALAVFMPGVVLGNRYRLDREIGRGGMGVVFLGHDRVLDSPVAIKAMLPPRLGRSAEQDQVLRELFHDEARIGAGLRSQPAIASVFDFGFHEGLPYAVFEFVPGEPLRELIQRRGRFPLEEARLLLAPVAQALDFAHARRVVHRDLKPENIRVTPEGHPKVLDLGLARVFDREERWSFAGTPAYAAPEQAAGEPIDGRADQYALGLIAFELLAGRRPFVGTNVEELLRMHREQPPPDPRSLVPDLPEEVAAAILKALSKRPTDRFSSCEALARALGCRFLSDAPAAPMVLREAECRPDPRSSSREVDRAYLTLSPRSLWVNSGGVVAEWPLEVLDTPRIHRRRALRLRATPAEGPPIDLEFLFQRPEEATAWRDAIVGATKLAIDTPVDRPRSVPKAPAPVVLLRQAPATRHQVLGPVAIDQASRRAAEGLLANRGALVEANAVVDLRGERRFRFDRTTYQLTGVAIRALDADGRIDLRSRWFEEEAGRIGTRMTLIWFVYFIVLALATMPQLLRLGSNRDASWTSLILGLGYPMLVLGWLLLMTLAMRRLKWPQMAHPAAITLAGYGWAQIWPAVGMGLGLIAKGSISVGLPLMIVLAVSGLVFLGFIRFHFHVARRAWNAHDLMRAGFGDQPPPSSPQREAIARWATVVAGLITIVIVGLNIFGGFGLTYSIGRKMVGAG